MMLDSAITGAPLLHDAAKDIKPKIEDGKPLEQGSAVKSSPSTPKKDGKKDEKKADKKTREDDDDIPLDQLKKKAAKEKSPATGEKKKKAKSEGEESKKRKAEEDVDIVGEGVVTPVKEEKKKSKREDSSPKEEKKDKEKKKKKKKEESEGGIEEEPAPEGAENGGGAGEEGGECEEGEDDEAKWWKQQGAGDGKKWHTLIHSGVLFPPPYIPHGRPVIYDGTISSPLLSVSLSLNAHCRAAVGDQIKLTPEQEEWATYYANYLETDHVKNKIFNKNFFEDWLKILNPNKSKEVHFSRPIVTVSSRR